MRLTITVDWLALDILEHQERQPLVGHSAVIETGDVRMAQRGQNLALGAEAFDIDVRVEPRAQEFERDVLLELPVGALREENASHAAATNLPHDPVVADPATDVPVAVDSFMAFHDESRGQCAGWCFQKMLRGRYAAEVLRDFSPKFYIRATARLEDRIPLLRLARQRLVQDFFNLSPSFGIEERRWQRRRMRGSSSGIVVARHVAAASLPARAP